MIFNFWTNRIKAGSWKEKIDVDLLQASQGSNVGVPLAVLSCS